MNKSYVGLCTLWGFASLFLIGCDNNLCVEATNICIDAARAHLQRIDLFLANGITCATVDFTPQIGVTCEQDEDDDDEGELETKIRIAGPFVLNLITGVLTPDLDSITLPTTAYREIKVRIDEAESDGNLLAAGDQLIGNSFVAAGTFTDANGEHNFNLALEFDEDIEATNSAAVELSRNDIEQLVQTIDVKQWFTGVNLAQCINGGGLSLDATNTLTIDDDTEASGICGQIEALIRDNIENSITI